MIAHNPVCVQQFGVQVRQDGAFRPQVKEDGTTSQERLVVRAVISEGPSNGVGDLLGSPTLASRPAQERDGALRVRGGYQRMP